MDHDEAPNAQGRRSRLKAILLLLVIFILGVVVGVGGLAMLMADRLKDAVRHPETAEGPSDRVIDRIGDDLEDHLDLTPEENQAVREELAVGHGELREIRKKLLHDVRDVIGETVGRIEDRLPEEKRPPFRERVGERLDPWGLDSEP